MVAFVFVCLIVCFLGLLCVYVCLCSFRICALGDLVAPLVDLGLHVWLPWIGFGDVSHFARPWAFIWAPLEPNGVHPRSTSWGLFVTLWCPFGMCWANPSMKYLLA